MLQAGHLIDQVDRERGANRNQSRRIQFIHAKRLTHHPNTRYTPLVMDFCPGYMPPDISPRVYGPGYKPRVYKPLGNKPPGYKPSAYKHPNITPPTQI